MSSHVVSLYWGRDGDGLLALACCPAPWPPAGPSGARAEELEDHLPVAAEYRGHVAGASPIRVIRLVYASGLSERAQLVVGGKSLWVVGDDDDNDNDDDDTVVGVGKGQAVQFNWILEKGGFVLSDDGTVAVDFDKVRGAVESLSRKILTIQAQGDRAAAQALLDEYAVIGPPLQAVLDRLTSVRVPVDITPSYTVESDLASL
eukprot:jgi/Mesen1/2052/ME000150S01140